MSPLTRVLYTGQRVTLSAAHAAGRGWFRRALYCVHLELLRFAMISHIRDVGGDRDVQRLLSELRGES